MLTTSPAELVRLFLLGGMLGALFGAVYDALRITRILMGVRYGRSGIKAGLSLPMPRWMRGEKKRLSRHRLRDFWVNVEDILYFLFVGPMIAIYLSEVNHGRIRWLAFAGIALGFFLYRCTVGELVIRFSVWIADILRFLAAWLCYGVSRPFLWLYRLIRILLLRVTCRLVRLWLWLYLPGHTRRAKRRAMRRIGRLFTNLEWGDVG